VTSAQNSHCKPAFEVLYPERHDAVDGTPASYDVPGSNPGPETEYVDLNPSDTALLLR